MINQQPKAFRWDAVCREKFWPRKKTAPVQKPKLAPADPETVVDLLLKVPNADMDGWFVMDDILTATAGFGIEANPATLLDALRKLYRQKRVEHKRNGAQHAFRLANVAVEIAQMDAAYIENELHLTHWTTTGQDYYRVKAVPNAAFWTMWKRDSHYIKNRKLSVQRDENRKWAVYCYDEILADILLRRNAS